MTITKLDDQLINDILIKGHNFQVKSELRIDSNRFLDNTEKVNDCIWLLTPDHYLHEQDYTSFIITILPEYDEEEGIDYETWKNVYLPEEFNFWLEDRFDLGTESKVEELREGYYWTTFLVQFKK